MREMSSNSANLGLLRPSGRPDPIDDGRDRGIRHGNDAENAEKYIANPLPSCARGTTQVE